MIAKQTIRLSEQMSTKVVLTIEPDDIIYLFDGDFAGISDGKVFVSRGFIEKINYPKTRKSKVWAKTSVEDVKIWELTGKLPEGYNQPKKAIESYLGVTQQDALVGNTLEQLPLVHETYYLYQAQEQKGRIVAVAPKYKDILTAGDSLKQPESSAKEPVFVYQQNDLKAFVMPLAIHEKITTHLIAMKNALTMWEGLDS